MARSIAAIGHQGAMDANGRAVGVLGTGIGVCYAKELAASSLSGSQKKLYELLNAEEPMPIGDIVERSGLNSSDVLATLFDLEMKGIIRQLPGKQFSKVLL